MFKINSIEMEINNFCQTAQDCGFHGFLLSKYQTEPACKVYEKCSEQKYYIHNLNEFLKYHKYYFSHFKEKKNQLFKGMGKDISFFFY